jgi:thiosulfate dehydrogenase (quinone) large subunit
MSNQSDLTQQPEPTATSRSRQWAYFILRVSLGINMFVHGTGRMYQGVHNWVATTEKLFIGNILPMWLVHGFLTILPFMEAAIGVLLVLGLWTHWALVWEGFVLIVLLFGMGLRADFAAIPTAGAVVARQMVYLLTFYVLLAMINYNRFSLDTLFAARRRD